MKKSCFSIRHTQIFLFIGFLFLGSLLTFPGFFLIERAAAQVGRCTTLMQSYITCNDVSGRNSTVPDISKRFGGISNRELIFSESIVGAPDIEPFRFSPPRDSTIVGLSELSFSGQSRGQTRKPFFGVSPSFTMPLFNSENFTRTQMGSPWSYSLIPDSENVLSCCGQE